MAMVTGDTLTTNPRPERPDHADSGVTDSDAAKFILSDVQHGAVHDVLLQIAVGPGHSAV